MALISINSGAAPPFPRAQGFDLDQEKSVAWKQQPDGDAPCSDLDQA
jgi:hypothetical protein